MLVYQRVIGFDIKPTVRWEVPLIPSQLFLAGRISGWDEIIQMKRAMCAIVSGPGYS
jgi:hypothetical protein